MMNKRLLAYFLLLNIWLTGACLAKVSLNPIFTDNMVLQHDMNIPVYGTAADGEKITVTLAGNSITTICKGGSWKLFLPPIKAGGPYTMKVMGQNVIELNNILLGDVWVLAGQSNMARCLKDYSTINARLAQLKENQNIRLFKIKQAGIAEDEPSKNVVIDPFFKNSWQSCDRDFIKETSPAGYFFAVHRYEMNKVPIGLIYATRGATRAASWTPMRILKNNPAYSPILDPQSNNDYKPSTGNPDAVKRPSALYNGTIYPLQPYAIKGVLWYQGESDSRYAKTYRTLFPDMIEAWRDDWAQGDFPFVFVQISSFQDRPWNPDQSPCQAWAWLREAQTYALNLPNTAMAVSYDLGEWQDIHPQDKETVGKRLALAAASLDGENITASGPVYTSHKIMGDSVIISFDNIAASLQIRTVKMNNQPDLPPTTDPNAHVADGRRLTGFTICGKDRIFHPAEAKIKGSSVIVKSPLVKNPLAVRYAWTTFALANLFNSDRLPAVPFRTDDFPIPEVSSQWSSGKR
jgi:sialate O-acetylesterase